MQMKLTIDIPESHIVTITLPPEFPKGKAEVIVKDSVEMSDEEFTALLQEFRANRKTPPLGTPPSLDLLREDRER